MIETRTPEGRINNIFHGMGTRWVGYTRVYGYFTQLWIGRARLHLFYKGEPSVMMHDHAWPFYTFPLRSYVDKAADQHSSETRIQLVRAFRLHYRPSSYTHKYLGRWAGTFDELGNPNTKPGTVVTLAYRGKLDREWGYWKITGGTRKFYPFKEYLKTIEARWARMKGKK